MCNASVKSSPSTNQHPTFYRPDALPVVRCIKALKGRSITFQAHLGDLPTLTLTTKGTWLSCGRVSKPLVSPLTPCIHVNDKTVFDFQFSFNLPLFPEITTRQPESPARLWELMVPEIFFTGQMSFLSPNQLSLSVLMAIFQVILVSRCLLKQRMMEVVATTGLLDHAKLQSNHHHQQTNIQFFTGRMPFLSPNQQCQSTELSISVLTAIFQMNLG